GLGLLTAAHVLAKKMLASSPSIPVADTSATEITSHEHVDVGRVALKVRIPVYLRFGDSKNLKVGDSIRVLGFPRYVKGASVHVQEGKISQYSPWHGVPHFVVDCPI